MDIRKLEPETESQNTSRPTYAEKARRLEPKRHLWWRFPQRQRLRGFSRRTRTGVTSVQRPNPQIDDSPISATDFDDRPTPSREEKLNLASGFNPVSRIEIINFIKKRGETRNSISLHIILVACSNGTSRRLNIKKLGIRERYFKWPDFGEILLAAVAIFVFSPFPIVQPITAGLGRWRQRTSARKCNNRQLLAPEYCRL